MNNSTITLPTIIKVDKKKCVNCHACIGVCPVKYCNDATNLEEGIIVNADLCIACGACIKECSHDARYYVDDAELFFEDLKKGENISILVAPAIYVHFDEHFYNLLGWFKSIGVKKSFDVSFGAEITTYQYYKAIQAGVKTPVIAQPCPAVVTYIEIYKPDLIEHLAPTGSPTMDIATWVHHNHPGTKLAFISPCTAKKREFEDPNTNGKVTYNVTIKKLKEYLLKNNINLKDYQKARFDGPAEAEKGLLYSQPGGLYETFKRYNVKVHRHQIRKTEGKEIYVEYFDELEKDIKSGECDVILVDILNCLHGCNRGTGTNYDDLSTDKILKIQNKRCLEHLENHYPDDDHKQQLEEILSNMEDIDFSRKYTDKSKNFKKLLIPNEEQIKILNEEMGKFEASDIKNCHSCGYKSCENMATAILNGLYRPEQCHHYLEKYYFDNINKS